MKNVPEAKKFIEAGVRSLNRSWDLAAKMIIKFHDSFNDLEGDLLNEEEDLESDMSLEQIFWRKAQPNLELSLTCLMQGIELILKGLIAKTSPFLILEDRPKWKVGIDFLELRSLPSEDLIDVYQAISDIDILGDDFRKKFNELRKARNRIVHSGIAKSPIEIEESIENILYFYSLLCPELSWSQNRLSFVGDALNHLDGYSSEIPNHLKEFGLIIELLPPALIKKIWGVEKKKKPRYYCQDCFNSFDTSIWVLNEEIYRTLFKSVKKSSTPKIFENYKCTACDVEVEIQRFKCTECEAGAFIATLPFPPPGPHECVNCRGEEDFLI